MNGLRPRRIVVLAGGVGGARMSGGVALAAPEAGLTVVVNTGDDFEHLGLSISPDLDTQLYTLAGLENPEPGWGRRDETWAFMDALEAVGGPGWFRLGDRDLALHAERTRRLAAGDSLTAIAAHFAKVFGVAARLAPMSDDPVRIVLDTDAGHLSMQNYLVRERAKPTVRRILFEGAERARPGAAALAALADPRLDAVVIAPSNPFLSIDPILAVPGIREALAKVAAPVVAVTPIIGGESVKGPLAKIMREFGLAVSPLTIAAHYRGLVDGIVIDEVDSRLADRFDIPCHVAPTLMRSDAQRSALGRVALDFASALVAGRHTQRRKTAAR